MAIPTSPAVRLQVIALHEAHCTQKQISSQLAIHYQTVARIVKEHDSDRKAKDSAAIATRDDILRRMTIIMQTTDKTTDSIAAGKLIAMMEGWLTPEQGRAAQVNVNILGSTSLSVIEKEYAALMGKPLGSVEVSADASEAGGVSETVSEPTTHAAQMIDSEVSADASDAIVGRPEVNLLASGAAENEVDGVEPPNVAVEHE